MDFLYRFSPFKQLVNPAVLFGLQLQGMMFGDIPSSTLIYCLFIAISELLAGFLAQLVFKKYLNQCKKWRDNAK